MSCTWMIIKECLFHAFDSLCKYVLLEYIAKFGSCVVEFEENDKRRLTDCIQF